MDNNENVVNMDDETWLDDVESTPTETPEVAETKEEVTEQEQTSSSEEPSKATDEEKLLEYLNTKEIKYNGEKVTVKNLDDLINTYQKGLNYDNLKSKQDRENNAALSFLDEKAKAANMTVEQYIEQVKQYEKEQEQRALEDSIQNMVSNGIDEVTARRVAEVEAFKTQLEKEKAELAKQREEIEKKAKEDKEYEDFIKAYPDVKFSEIPDEVFKESKTIGLTNAYAKYENKLLKEKIKMMEQNTKNASNSLVTGVTDGSPTEQESKDAFLEGFDSVV